MIQLISLSKQTVWVIKVETFQNTNLVHSSFNLHQYIYVTRVEECSVTYILLKIKRIVH